MQPFQCDLQAQIPKHPITTHTQAHPKQLEATVTMRQKKKANRPQPHPPHRRGTFHRRLQPLYTEKRKVSCYGFLPKTDPLQHHAAIPMRSASTDSKTPYNYAHTSTPKAAWSHRYNAAKKKANRPQPHPPHRRGTFHRRLQPLYTEKDKVLCSGFLPKTEPLQHHAAIPMRSASTDSKTPYNYAHTSTPKAAWSHRYNAAKKKGKPTAAAPAAQTRYLSSPAAATLHGKTQGFVLQLPPQHKADATSCSHSNAICHHSFKKRIELRTQTQPLVAKHIGGTIRAWNDRSRNRRTAEVPFIAGCSHFTRKNTRFRAPASSPKQTPCNIMHHSPSWSLHHHFPSSSLPFVTTSLHHFPSSPLPFVTTPLHHHFLSSPLPFFTTSLRHQFCEAKLAGCVATLEQQINALRLRVNTAFVICVACSTCFSCSWVSNVVVVRVTAVSRSVTAPWMLSALLRMWRPQYLRPSLPPLTFQRELVRNLRRCALPIGMFDLLLSEKEVVCYCL